MSGARLVRVRGLLLQTFRRAEDLVLRPGDLQGPGGRPGVHHVHDGAELAAELPLPGWGSGGGGGGGNTGCRLTAWKLTILMKISFFLTFFFPIFSSHQRHVDRHERPGCAWILRLVQRALGHLHLLGPGDPQKPQLLQ